MLKFFFFFMLLLAVMFGIEMLQPVQQALVHPWTGLLAHMSAWLMMLFDDGIVASGRIIQSKLSGFGVSIEAGCNGVEAAIILVAGMLAFPSNWKQKLAGIAIGIVAVQAVNLLRIISLFYLGQWSFKAFEFAHLYLWQALIMLDVLVVWMLWVRVVSPPAPAQAMPEAGHAA
jgi:exosortase H (IPTLxxWG-CTERM-specific)